MKLHQYTAHPVGGGELTPPNNNNLIQQQSQQLLFQGAVRQNRFYGSGRLRLGGGRSRMAATNTPPWCWGRQDAEGNNGLLDYKDIHTLSDWPSMVFPTRRC